jgi:hypothetical protein
MRTTASPCRRTTTRSCAIHTLPSLALMANDASVRPPGSGETLCIRRPSQWRTALRAHTVKNRPPLAGEKSQHSPHGTSRAQGTFSGVTRSTGQRMIPPPAVPAHTVPSRVATRPRMLSETRPSSIE